MNDTVSGFKHNVFGGFRQSDVIDYVKSIAKQRNDYYAKCQTTSDSLQQLQKENDDLITQLEELKENIEELNKENARLKAQIDSCNTDKCDCELDIEQNLLDTLGDISAALTQLQTPTQQLHAKVSDTCQSINKCVDMLKQSRTELNKNIKLRKK